MSIVACASGGAPRGILAPTGGFGSSSLWMRRLSFALRAITRVKVASCELRTFTRLAKLLPASRLMPAEGWLPPWQRVQIGLNTLFWIMVSVGAFAGGGGGGGGGGGCEGFAVGLEPPHACRKATVRTRSSSFEMREAAELM